MMRATPWKVLTNGSSNECARGIGVVLQSPKRDIIECAVQLQFLTTNNEAENEAILIGLDWAKVARASLVVLHSDSQVIVRHMNGDYKAKGEWMKKYLNLIKRQMSQAFTVEFLQVPREENKHTARLAKAAFAEHMVVD